MKISKNSKIRKLTAKDKQRLKAFLRDHLDQLLILLIFEQKLRKFRVDVFNDWDLKLENFEIFVIKIE